MRPSELAPRPPTAASVLWRRLAVGMLLPPLVALALSTGDEGWAVGSARVPPVAEAAGDVAAPPRAPEAALVPPTTPEPALTRAGIPAAAETPVDDLRRPVPLPPPSTAAPAAVDTARAAGMTAALAAARSTFEVPGLSFAIVGDEGVRWSGTTGTIPAAEMPLVVGSVTKTFVAALVLQLVDEGGLGLDDPITDHVPEALVAKGVTIRQLLAHTSGIADLFTPEMNQAIDEAPGRVWHPGEVLAGIGEGWFAPGTAWAYSNTNYLLLGMLVERTTGHSLDDLIARRFTGPLDLGHTGLIGPDGAGMLDPALASAFWASGSMHSTSTDIARWGHALYGGDILSTSMLHAMLTFNEDDYGLGTQRVELEPKLSGVGHSGLLGTYTTLLVHLPSEDVTIAIIAQQSRTDLHGVLAHRERGAASLLDLVLGRTPPPPSPSPTTVAAGG